MKLFTFIFFALITNVVFPQSSKLSIAKVPAWVTTHVVDYGSTLLDKYATEGYIDVGYEIQVSLASQSEYVRHSKKIISQAGVQNGSQISIVFNPSYQQLFFHAIRIIRNGETINKLQLSNIKTVHQEKELNNFIYNGTLNALLILEDVRKGDIIEWSYTLKGFNPIFKNKYAEDFSLQYGVPMYNIYYKLVVPKERMVKVKNLNTKIEPVISTVDGAQVYEWQKNNVPPLVRQDYTPSWFNPYASILVSEYTSWKEVNNWAMELFPIKAELGAALQKMITEIKVKHNSDEQRASAALRFVQDDIRYMGIEMGINSHKPASPAKVFAQRFGDCKEKSYLLCVMLRAMNIEACPVLINSDGKKATDSLLPAPTAFDHVTVRVKLDNDYYWLDPTIAYQRGNIKNLFYPDYQKGLVIDAATTEITTIVFKRVSKQHIVEYFTATDIEGGATLVVTTIFQGGEADVVRNDFNEESNTELLESYKKFYAAYYDDIKADSLTYTDNDSSGIFTTKEYYSLPQFWTKTKAVKRFSFSAFIINSHIKKPKDKSRTMPFRLAYPSKYDEEVIILLPDNWKVNESETHVKNECFAYNNLFYSAFNTVHIAADYENFKDNGSIEDASIYFKDMATIDGDNNFEITSGNDNVENVASNNPVNLKNDNIVSGIVIFLVVIGFFIFWSRRR